MDKVINCYVVCVDTLQIRPKIMKSILFIFLSKADEFIYAIYLWNVAAFVVGLKKINFDQSFVRLQPHAGLLRLPIELVSREVNHCVLKL